MISKNAEELAVKILEWEYKAGESFVDYFMDGKVLPVSWAFWLLGKGYSKHANTLIDLLTAKQRPDQDIKFSVNVDYESGSWDQEAYEKDVLLYAEFLTASDRYFKTISEWFAEPENNLEV